MVYSTFADYSKKTINWAVENTFPSNPAIATVTGAVGWYGYRVGLTYAPNIINTWICAQIGYLKGLVAAPLITPSLTPYIALYISIGSSFAISITLNLIATIFFKIKAHWNARSANVKVPHSNPEDNQPLKLIDQRTPGGRINAVNTKAIGLGNHFKPR
ncbi:MAG TPA: hypothetical protein VGP47_01090, partial [Parachlamydiaceae bacterium]|nr:hypothetical protein [Parachlamydiaceae bacterium]